MEYRNFPLERIRIVDRSAHVIHVLEQIFEHFFAVIKNYQALSRIPAWPPNPITAVAADGFRQAVFMAKEVDSARLAIVLGENAAVTAFVGIEAIPRDGCFSGDLVPTELVGVPLWQNRTRVRVFHDRQLERQLFHVSDEVIGREDGNRNRRNIRSHDKQSYNYCPLQPCSPWLIEPRFNRHRTGREQHRINRREVVNLSMQREEDSVTDQITPAEDSIRRQRRPEQQCDDAGDPYGRGKWAHVHHLTQKKINRAEHNVPALGADGVHELEKRPLIVNIPEQIRQEYRNAAAPPSHIHLFNRNRRWLVRTRPATMAIRKNAIEYFSSNPSPATTPNHTQ